MDEVILPSLRDDADEAYLSARLLNLAGLHTKSAYMAHLAVELYLKLLIAETRKLTLKDLREMGHDLKDLLKQCRDSLNDKEIESLRPLIEEFDDYDQVGRYGPNATFDPNKKKGQGFMTRGGIVQDNYLHKLDRIVAVLRSKVSAATSNQGDRTIENIKSRNAKHAINQDWKLETPASAVLSTDNDQYQQLGKRA
jgi:HEPN domain-containing protein